jgi:ubiquinone/menaquinone biosynthesis C-methylase UbiE
MADSNYINVVYDEGSRAYTKYPAQLCAHLFNTFNMKPGMKLLEPGCGRGEFLYHYQQLGLDCHGLDLSPEAQAFLPDVPIPVCDVNTDKFPYDDNTFDVIYSKSLLEHLREPDHFFEEAYRILKPGGMLLCLVPDWETQYKTYFDDHTHRTPFTVFALIDIYRMSGFERSHAYRFRQLPIVWRFPVINYFCAAISPFIPVRTQHKFLRWSRELMLVGCGYKPVE